MEIWELQLAALSSTNWCLLVELKSFCWESFNPPKLKGRHLHLSQKMKQKQVLLLQAVFCLTGENTHQQNCGFVRQGAVYTKKTRARSKSNAGQQSKVRSMESSSSCFRRRSARQQSMRSEPLCTPKSTPSQLKRNKQCWSNGVLN